MRTYSERKKFYDDTDRQILDMYQTSPHAAFRLMFDTYYKPLCLYCVQLSDSLEAAEDIVQDFFIDFWEKKIYRNIAVNLRGYLFNAVRNNTYIYLKKHNKVSMEELSETEIDFTDSLVDDSELYARERRLMLELEKLPRQELLAVKAVILENKKYKEAAAELNISVNTLKTHLSRALKRLRKDTAYLLFII